jgi:hypothetical protein
MMTPRTPTTAVLAVGENVGGLPVTIESVFVLRVKPDGGTAGVAFVPTDTDEKFPFPEFPVVLRPRDVLQVPVTAAWFRQQLATFEQQGAWEFVLWLEDDKGVYFESPLMRISRFHEDCPMWSRGDSGLETPRLLMAKLRRYRVADKFASPHRG